MPPDFRTKRDGGLVEKSSSGFCLLWLAVKQEAHVHGLNLKIIRGDVSREDTSSIEAQPGEESSTVGMSAADVTISVLR